ncbi:MAG: hypothetical protein HRU17_07865 [Polyangiaceae bacterium]|nr:hypothetical protein [Polyangiaceae bacterium]
MLAFKPSRGIQQSAPPCASCNWRLSALEKDVAAGKESTGQLRPLNGQAIAGIMILQDSRFQYANEGFAQFVGDDADADALIAWDPDRFITLIHEDDRVFVDQQAQRKQHGDPNAITTYEARMVAKGGSVV